MKAKTDFYIGYTSNLEERIIRHNQKGKGFTGSTNDWRVVYFEKHKIKELLYKENYKLNLGKVELKFWN